ncbi:DMT family transporter [Actinospica sp.]|jgi:drug/metabolite transporter (DMT)-like permease|uniref:DMT family transporter n=1 Tax=Actinospica sp. TaxID=1872142 RepID=UPI002C776B41|nr:DMT family transporter [Actinospica sp.]HWG25708.1 DMT family transporter [Actinospica sp.]
MTRRAWLLFAAMGVIWGIPYLMIKVVVDAGVSPGFLVFARTAIGAVLLLPVAIRQGAVRPALAQWKPVLAFAAIELGVTWYLLNSAEEKLNSSVVALLIAMVPLIGTLIAWRLGDRSVLRPVRLGGLAIGLGGVGVVVGVNLTSGGTPAWAVGAVVLTSIGYAIAPMIADRRLSEVPGLGVTAVALTVVALAYLPFGVFDAPAHLPRFNVLASIVGLGVICTALAFICFFELIAEAGAVRATVITYVNPAVALLCGVAMLGEKLTAGIIIGFPLVLLGSYFATRKDRPAALPDAALAVEEPEVAAR